MSLAGWAFAYQTNLDEAREGLQTARFRYDNLCRDGAIFRDDDGVTRCKTADAAKVYGDFVRFRSDWQHWAERLRLANRDAGREAVAEMPAPRGAPPAQQDLRLPPEPTDEQLEEAAARKAELAAQLAAYQAAQPAPPPEAPPPEPIPAPPDQAESTPPDDSDIPF